MSCRGRAWMKEKGESQEMVGWACDQVTRCEGVITPLGGGSTS